MPKQKTIFEPRDVHCAKWMFGLLCILNPNIKTPNFESWANEIRLMREADGRNYKEIFDVFSWANKNSFWCSNILSPKALRRQFDRLVIQMKHEPGGSRNLKDAVTRTYENFQRKFGNYKA